MRPNRGGVAAQLADLLTAESYLPFGGAALHPAGLSTTTTQHMTVSIHSFPFLSASVMHT